jgi:hypothetical protein
MSIRNFFGGLLVALSVSMAIHSIWESIFTYNQMGYFAILLGMSMFIFGAVLTRRSQPREEMTTTAAQTSAIREARAPGALPASQSRLGSDWARGRVMSEETQAENVRSERAQ